MSDTIETTPVTPATQSTANQRVQQFRLPDLGEGLEEGQLVQWLVAVGDAIHLNQPLAQIETAKALVDIPSPFAGVVQTLHAKPGDSVPVGGLLITVALTPGPSPTGGGEVAEEGSGPVLVGYGAGGPAQTFARRRRAPTPGPSPTGRGEVHGSPDLALRHLAHPTIPPLPAGEGPDEERMSTVGLRKAIAAKMMRSATTIPHFTEYGLFDATNLTALREQLRGDPRFGDTHLTFLPFFVAGLVTAVRQYPIMNSRWDEEGSAIVIKHSLHVGLATDTPRGLVVPVLRNAQARDLAQVAAEATRLIGLARGGTITPADMVGGTITITNVGAAGPVETGAPLINAPEVCVVGFGAIKPRPTVVGDQVMVRPGAWISISCDHRVVDGATAAQFMGALVTALEQPKGLAG